MYLTDFLVLHPKTKFNGYPLILGRAWLATIDSYLSCRARNMTIKNGHLSKQLVLYPPAQPSIEHDLPLWLEEGEEEEFYQTSLYPVYTLDTITGGGHLDGDKLIDHILQNQPPTTIPVEEPMKEYESSPWTELCYADSNLELANIFEIGPSVTLNINPYISDEQEEHLCSVLRQDLDVFSWDYMEMNFMNPLVFTHNIYIKEGCKPVRQP